jgi:hypothetical protein
MASSLKFVDSIASSPTTRLDLNDRTTWRLHTEGTQFSPPPLDQAVASTLLADGAVIPASAYGLRTIQLMLSVNAASADATATQLQNFYRELNRPVNFLRWQQETTNPVFFRTFRTSADEVQDLGKIDGTRKLLSVAFLAEPFAYGLLETPVSAVTVSADPAAGSNGCFVDVTGVKGDVESPALIRWPESAVAETRQSLFAVRRRGTPSGTPFVFQAEAMTQGPDTTTQANDAAFSGAGNNYSRCTFSTNALLTARLTLTDLGTASVDLRGTYRVFVRYRKNTSGDGINLRLVWGDGSRNDVITNDTFATPNTTNITMADLGLISIPYGLDSVYDFRSGTELVVDDRFRIEIEAGRTSGSGSLDLDFVLLVPADDRFGLIEWGETESASDRRWLDALDWSVHGRTSADEVVSVAAPAARSGGLPLLTPNQTNRIYMLYEVAESRAHAIATTTTVSVAYYPLYLTVRPAST